MDGFSCSFFIFPQKVISIYQNLFQIMYKQITFKVQVLQKQSISSQHQKSMEFVKLQSFKLPCQSIKDKPLTNRQANKRSQKTKITSIRFTSNKQCQSLFCGLSDGTVMQFTQKKYSQKKLTQNKQYQTRHFDFANAHKGEIKVILLECIFNQYFLLTGSADRTIKIWDVQPKSRDIVQTLTGHSGTILAMIYSRKTDTIFTGSTDKTVRVWKQDQSRKFFLYPWYTCYQTISQFVSKKTQHPVYPSAFDLHDGEVNSFILYMGDSAGNLHVIKEIELPQSYEQSFAKPRTAFQIDRSNYNYHRLAISNIVYVAKQHLVVTVSFDQNIYVFESLSDKLLLKMYNPRKVNYTSIVWYNNMLVAADQNGVIYCKEINSDKPVEEIKKFNCKIYQLNCIQGSQDLFVLTDDGVDAVKLIKGIKAVEGGNSHTQAITGMFALQVHKLTQNKIKDQSKLITVSLDNTMRVWDPADLTCLQVMKNPQKCEITALFYLKRANLFVTGHEDGTVRLWNIELQTSITIKQDNNPHGHANCISAFAEFIHIRGQDDVTEYMFSTGYEGKVSVWQIFIKKSSVQSTLMSSTISPQLKFSFYPNTHQQTTDQIGYQLFALQIWSPTNLLSPSQDQQCQVEILSAGSKGEVYFTRMFSYQTYRKVKIHDDTINCMIIDANILFTGGYDCMIKLTSLETLEMLICLDGHQEPVTHMAMIDETGHLLSHSSEGEIAFWDYPQGKIVKKIRQKKQRIMSYCYVDELRIIYLGTEGAKILTHDLKYLYQNKVIKSVSRYHHHHTQMESATGYTSAELERILMDNQEELAKLMM